MILQFSQVTRWEVTCLQRIAATIRNHHNHPHHHAVCLTSPQPLPNRVLHRIRSSASSFNFQNPLVSLRSSSSCLRLPPRLPVTSRFPTIFPSITHFRWFLPIQLATFVVAVVLCLTVLYINPVINPVSLRFTVLYCTVLYRTILYCIVRNSQIDLRKIHVPNKQNFYLVR